MPDAIPSDRPTAAPTVQHFILGTAGHIDHGKTSLVRALTGVNTDRLEEERRRGMTIELGFAELTIGAARFGMVDVPGHERFVRTMVAGVTGIDIALLVVAADDSVMPQTLEHVDILHLLGVTHAVVAVTKTDVVDGELVELVVDEVSELLDGTALAGAPLCPVSSITGEGIDELRTAILEVSRKTTRSIVAPPFRMAVDRVFTVQGRGTVVTGSLHRGIIVEGDTIDVLPVQRACRVRGIQTHGAQAESVTGGQRAAINVTGIDRELIDRGSQIATPGYLQPARMIDVRLEYLESCPRPLKSASTVRLEFGTTEARVRVVLLEGSVLRPGQTTYAQLRSGDPLFTAYGQRFIMRDENASRTIGGGIVLRPVSLRKRRDKEIEVAALRTLESGDPAARAEEVLRAARFAQPTDLQLCAQTGIELDEIAPTLEQLRQGGRWGPIGKTDTCATPSAIDDVAGRMTAWMRRYHRQHPELPGRSVDSVIGYLERMAERNLARPLFETFLKRKTIQRLGRFACLPEFAPSLSAADEQFLAALSKEILAAGFQPPSIDSVSPTARADRKTRQRLATLAVALGELVEVGPKLYLHTDAERELRDRVAAAIAEYDSVSVADVRELLGSTRKFVVPFLEYLDRIRFTKRSGDRRTLHPDRSE